MTGSNHRAQTSVVRQVPSTQPSLTEQVTLSLPLDEAGCHRAGVLAPKHTLPRERIAALHDCIRNKQEDAEEVAAEIDCLAHDCGTSPAALFLMAVDPSAGDTLFHTAIAAQRPDVLERLIAFFPPNGRFALGEKALFRHANDRGETMLHVAVRTGSLDMVRAAYNLFRGDASSLEELTEEPADGGWDPYESDDVFLPSLAFLMARDKDGRDAGTLADSAGAEDLAAWVRRLASELDPEDRWNKDSEQRREWEEWLRGYYQHEYREVPEEHA